MTEKAAAAPGLLCPLPSALCFYPLWLQPYLFCPLLLFPCFFNASRAGDLLFYLRRIAFVFHMAHTTHIGIDADAGIDFRTADSGDLYFGVFALQVVTISMTGAGKLNVQVFGLSFEFYRTASG